MRGATQPPGWCGRYVGLPFKDKGRGPDGYDCWGLARAILAEQFGLQGLPDYAGTYAGAKDWRSVEVAVRAGLACGWAAVQDAQPGDLVILKLKGHPWHCAVAVGGDWMLHVAEGTEAVLEQWTGPLWRNRVEGFYRYVGA